MFDWKSVMITLEEWLPNFNLEVLHCKFLPGLKNQFRENFLRNIWIWMLKILCRGFIENRKGGDHSNYMFSDPLLIHIGGFGCTNCTILSKKSIIVLKKSVTLEPLVHTEKKTENAYTNFFLKELFSSDAKTSSKNFLIPSRSYNVPKIKVRGFWQCESSFFLKKKRACPTNILSLTGSVESAILDLFYLDT